MNPEVRQEMLFWVGMLKDIGTVIVSVIAVTIAAKGLSTWRRQLRGQSSFEVARKLGAALMEFREELIYFRSPMVFAGEIEQACKHYGLDNGSSKAGDSAQVRMAPVYWKQERLDQKWNDIVKHAFDAELVLGHEVRKHILACRGIVTKIQEAVLTQSFYFEEKVSIAGRTTDERIRVTRTLYGTRTDAFGKLADGKIDSFIEYLEPFLRDPTRSRRMGFKSLPGRAR